MPRTGPRRPIVGVRISDAGIKAVDEIATELDVTRSEWIRALLAEAMAAPAVVRAARRRILAMAHPERPRKPRPRRPD